MYRLSSQGARSLTCFTYTSPTSMKPAWARGSVTATNARLVLAASCMQRPHVLDATLRNVQQQQPAQLLCRACGQFKARLIWSTNNSVGSSAIGSCGPGERRLSVRHLVRLCRTAESLCQIVGSCHTTANITTCCGMKCRSQASVARFAGLARAHR